MRPVHLQAPRYVLGELDDDHTTIAVLEQRIAEYKMVPKPTLWGWGRIRRTERGLEAMAVESGLTTLKAARTDPASVDALVLCSTGFPADNRDHGRFVQTVMTGIGLADADFTGITLGRCVNLLAAIRTAEAMVASARFHRVLVITTDRAEEADRVERFALFSDGAASCLVTAEPDHDADAYVLEGSAAAHDLAGLDWSSEISSDLARAVNERLHKDLGVRLEDVDGLLHSNIFRPIVTLKEMQAGFVPGQLYTANIPRIGHCFAADPLINLADRGAAGELRAGGRYLLAASVPGSRIGVLLRKATP